MRSCGGALALLCLLQRPAPAPRAARLSMTLEPPQPDQVPLQQGPRVDARGFKVPNVGDLVKVPSKWPGEFDVAIVDFVQQVPSRRAVEVDLLILKNVGDSLWRVPGRKPATIRADIGKLGRLDYEYAREFDAYRIDSSQLQPLVPKAPTDPDIVAQGIAEYDALKARLLRESAIVGAVGTLAAYVALGADVSGTFAAGAATGIAYVFLLGIETDSIGSAEPPPKAVALAASGRLALPALLMALLASQRSLAGSGFVPFSSLSKEGFAAATLGFLSYKAPLLARQIARALKELESEDAQAPVGAGGMQGGGLGLALRMARDQQKRRANKEEQAAAALMKKEAENPRQLLICGPSGVGKSTLVSRLIESRGDRFGFSVSTTTRPPRNGEVDGVSYNFVGRAEFERKIDDGDFLEWAEVGGNLYGTEISAVQKVYSQGRICVLDLDVRGVLSILERPDMNPLSIWVAPPSFEAIRSRLQERGTESSDEIEGRVARAREEIEFSLRSDCFDHVIVNDVLADAFSELDRIVDATFTND